jgi:hypothetical protein
MTAVTGPLAVMPVTVTSPGLSVAPGGNGCQRTGTRVVVLSAVVSTRMVEGSFRAAPTGVAV